MSPANWYVGARTIEARRLADNPCERRTLFGLPILFVNCGIIGTMTKDVISATANHGPNVYSFVPYILLNQRDINCKLTPEAKPTNPKVAENLVIC